MAWLSKLFGTEEEKPKTSAKELVRKAQAYIEDIQAPKDEYEEMSYAKFQTWGDTDSKVQYSSRDNYSRDKAFSVMRSGTGSNGTDWGLLSRDLGGYLNVGFVQQVQEYIRDRGLKDSTVYKAAQIDRRLFSKIMSDRSYKPAKDTCVAIALALELTLTEANNLLSRAGYTLSHSSKRDVILEFCFVEKIYDVSRVNDLLFRLEQSTLGR